MNISLKNNDVASGILKVEIEKNDYAELLEKNLHKLRRQVNIPGFRKGMVPLGIVKKLYGKHVLAEEINKLVTEKLYSYIRDNGIKILGEPLSNETEQKPINFDTDEDFEFCFDVALSPDIDFELTKKDKLIFYSLKIDDELIDKQIDSYRNNFGSYEKVDKAGEGDVIKGIVAELENGEPKVGGILVEEAVFMPSYMKGKMEQKKFIGAELNCKIVFNPYKAYKGAEAEIASFLNIEKILAKDMKSDFTFEIKEITRHKPAELNGELFGHVFGPDVIKDEAMFRDRIKDFLVEQLLPESNLRFMGDVRELLIKKVGDVVFADDILKRWLHHSNEKMTKEQMDADYPKVIEDMKYHFVKDKLVKENDIKIEEEEVDAYAKRFVKAQFVQYGIISVTDDMLEFYAKDMLKKEEMVSNIMNRIIDEKLSSLVKEKVTVKVKEVTLEEFAKVQDGIVQQDKTAPDEADA
ncbi:MAG: trigger factor [Tannerella sp.]|jgi:trigger factor|nr:trigger factor [Tannerella sp.]